MHGFALIHDPPFVGVDGGGNLSQQVAHFIVRFVQPGIHLLCQEMVMVVANSHSYSFLYWLCLIKR
jgi:hypothetical protein